MAEELKGLYTVSKFRENGKIKLTYIFNLEVPKADYQAFFAALLQRQNRHNEAIAHYQIVLQLAPNNAIWLMGYGISLRAVQRNAEAKDAFKRALETQTLSPELREFVQQKLKGL